MSQNQPNKIPKLFISHSSKDVSFVNPFCDMLLNCGIKNESMYCSSIPFVGTKLNGNFSNDIKKQFTDYDLYGVFIVSEHFLNSEFCVWEAKQIHTNKYVVIYLSDSAIQNERNVFDKNRVGINIHTQDVFYRFEEFKVLIEKHLHISLDTSKWNDGLFNLLSLYVSSLKDIRRISSLSKVYSNICFAERPVFFNELFSLNKEIAKETIIYFVEVLVELHLVETVEYNYGNRKRKAFRKVVNN